MEILKYLVINSRIPIIEISEKTRLSPKTIVERIKKLKQQEIIIGYRVICNLQKLGYYYFKVNFHFHDMSDKIEKNFREFLKQTPAVIYDDEVLGGDNIEISVQVKSLEELRNLLDEMKEKFSQIIKNYRYMLFHKLHKHALNLM